MTEVVQIEAYHAYCGECPWEGDIHTDADTAEGDVRAHDYLAHSAERPKVGDSFRVNSIAEFVAMVAVGDLVTDCMGDEWRQSDAGVAEYRLRGARSWTHARSNSVVDFNSPFTFTRVGGVS